MTETIRDLIHIAFLMACIMTSYFYAFNMIFFIEKCVTIMQPCLNQ